MDTPLLLLHGYVRPCSRPAMRHSPRLPAAWRVTYRRLTPPSCARASTPMPASVGRCDADECEKRGYRRHEKRRDVRVPPLRIAARPSAPALLLELGIAVVGLGGAFVLGEAHLGAGLGFGVAFPVLCALAVLVIALLVFQLVAQQRLLGVRPHAALARGRERQPADI